MKSFKLDKSVFKAQSFEEADKSNQFDKDLSLAESIKIVNQGVDKNDVLLFKSRFENLEKEKPRLNEKAKPHLRICII